MVRNKKFKAKKVATPGSQPGISPGRQKLSPGRGRPKKAKIPNTSRKANYRHKYNMEDLEKAVVEVKEGRLSIREAAKNFKVRKIRNF